MRPRGRLLIIGGAEDIGDEVLPLKEKIKTYQPFEILKELLHACKNKKIEIITTGSMVPNEVYKRYQKAFHAIGYPDPGFMSIQDKFEARDEIFLERIEKAGAVFFTGGDQFRLSTILGGTKITEIIKRRYRTDKDFLVAGTSAGAMAMSTVMIAGGGSEEVLVYRNLTTTSGLGFLNNCIIDTHFIKRGRFGRLAHAIIINPDQLGIGLGEDTALIIKHGTEAEVRGSGMVVIIDGKEMGQTNVMNAQEREPIYVENLKVHILVKGCRFSICSRELYNPSVEERKRSLRTTKKR
jgi:cyanophycinase